MAEEKRETEALIHVKGDGSLDETSVTREIRNFEQMGYRLVNREETAKTNNIITVLLVFQKEE